MRRSKLIHVARDGLAILLSVASALLLAKSGLFESVRIQPEYIILVSIVVGFFFTTMFTIAPAAVVLGELSLLGSPTTVVLGGALGAVIGDLFIFLIFRDHFTSDFEEILRHIRARRLRRLIGGKMFRFTAPILGALIIASPLPDELGLALLGLSKVRVGILIPVSFAMNAVGVLLVVLAAQALV